MCHLPLGNEHEENAFEQVISYIQDQKDREAGITGYTISDPTAFSGGWWSSKQGRWIQEPIVMLIIDYKSSANDPADDDFLFAIGQLKGAISIAYSTFGSKQEEIWIVSQDLICY